VGGTLIKDDDCIGKGRQTDSDFGKQGRPATH
jgi:hypothetical protein